MFLFIIDYVNLFIYLFIYSIIVVIISTLSVHPINKTKAILISRISCRIANIYLLCHM